MYEYCEENKMKNKKQSTKDSGSSLREHLLREIGLDGEETPKRDITVMTRLSQEIVDIISIHDSDSLEGIDWKEVYDTENKKIFHDFDRSDRFSQKRISNVSEFYKTKEDRKKLKKTLNESLDLFFYKEFKEKAKENFQKLDI